MIVFLLCMFTFTQVRILPFYFPFKFQIKSYLLVGNTCYLFLPDLTLCSQIYQVQTPKHQVYCAKVIHKFCFQRLIRMHFSNSLYSFSGFLYSVPNILFGIAAARICCLGYSKVYCDATKRWLLAQDQNRHISYSIFHILISN